MRFAFGVVASLGVACGGSDPPVEPTGILLEALAAELAAADCARLSSCNALPAPLSSATCQARQADLFYAPVVRRIETGVEAGSLSYFELAAKDCREAIGKLACTSGLDHPVLELPACAGMIRGLGAVGAPCPVPTACADGHYCGGEACPGTCRAYLSNNQACAGGERCGAGLYCDLVGRRCLAVSANGQPCGLSMGGNACATGSYCDQTNPASPVCRPVRGRGQGCGTDDECIVGARCISARCSEGAVGDGCERAADCDPELRCAAGRCAAPIAVGSACMATGAPCVPGASCTDGTCAELPESGEVCPNNECFLGRCVAGTCLAAEPDGAGCSAADECLPGRSCESQRCRLTLTCE